MSGCSCTTRASACSRRWRASSRSGLTVCDSDRAIAKQGLAPTVLPTTQTATAVRSGKRWPAKTSKTKVGSRHTTHSASAPAAPTAPHAPAPRICRASSSIAVVRCARAPHAAARRQHAQHDEGAARERAQRRRPRGGRQRLRRRVVVVRRRRVPAERRRHRERAARLRRRVEQRLRRGERAVAADGGEHRATNRRRCGRALKPRRRSASADAQFLRRGARAHVRARLATADHTGAAGRAKRKYSATAAPKPQGRVLALRWCCPPTSSASRASSRSSPARRRCSRRSSSSCAIWRGRPGRSAWRGYVVALSACDFLQGYFYFVVGLRAFRYNDELFCEAHAYVALWSATASFLWTACLTAYVAAFFWRGLPAKLNRAPARRTTAGFALCFGYPFGGVRRRRGDGRADGRRRRRRPRPTRTAASSTRRGASRGSARCTRRCGRACSSRASRRSSRAAPAHGAHRAVGGSTPRAILPRNSAQFSERRSVSPARCSTRRR